jgi:hypothetical protein
MLTDLKNNPLDPVITISSLCEHKHCAVTVIKLCFIGPQVGKMYLCNSKAVGYVATCRITPHAYVSVTVPKFKCDALRTAAGFFSSLTQISDNIQDTDWLVSFGFSHFPNGQSNIDALCLNVLDRADSRTHVAVLTHADLASSKLLGAEPSNTSTRGSITTHICQTTKRWLVQRGNKAAQTRIIHVSTLNSDLSKKPL